MDREVASGIDRRVLSDEQVAERLSISPFTLRAWRRKGAGPRFLKMGRAVRYRSEDVDEFVQAVLVEPSARREV